MTAVGVEPRTSGDNAAIRPFHVEIPLTGLGGPASPHRCGPAALQGAGRRSLAGRATGDDPGARALLAERLRLAQVRGEAERAAAIQDRDRRGGRPLHPREVATRERLAADHHSRVARLDHRDARDRRPAHRPDRSRWTGGRRLPPGAAVPPRIRLLGRAIRARLGRRLASRRRGGS